MKLNLVADYDVDGKVHVATFSILSSQNLIYLRKLTTLQFPTTDGKWVYIAPRFLQLCESRRRAEAIKDEWERDYREQERLYDFKPLGRYEIQKESEVTK